MKLRQGCIVAMLVGGVALLALVLSPEARCNTGGPGLKEAGDKASVKVGVALSWHALEEDNDYARALLRDFDAVTIEDATKWAAVDHAGDGTLDFSRPDRLVDFAEDHDLVVKGHTLAWDEHVPHRISMDIAPERFRERHQRFVEETVKRYRGEIQQWDVVNEALEEDGTVSQAVWFAKLGPDWIPRMFRLARELDPEAKLFYNDYSIEWDNEKQRGLLDLLRRLKADGVPVDGVGIQGHLLAGSSPSTEQWRQSIRRFAELGLEVHLSELDVRSGHLQGAPAGRQLARTRALYEAVRACALEPACTQITFWGLSDRHSWTNKQAPVEEPLLLDQELERKPEWYAVQAALQGQPLPGCADSLVEGAFEEGTGQWKAPGGSLSRVDGRNGKAMLHTGRANASTGPTLDLTDVVSEGNEYRLKLQVKTRSEGPVPVQITLRLTGSGGQARWIPLAKGSAGPDGWSTLEAGFQLEKLTPPLAVDERDIALYVEGPPAGVDLLVDDASLTVPCP